MNDNDKNSKAEKALNEFFKTLFIEEKNKKIKLREDQLKKTGHLKYYEITNRISKKNS